MHRFVTGLACAGIASVAMAGEVITPYFSVQGNATASATGTAFVTSSSLGIFDEAFSASDSATLGFSGGPNVYSFSASADTDGGLASNGTSFLPSYLQGLGVDPSDLSSAGLSSYFSGASVWSTLSNDPQFGGRSMYMQWSLDTDSFDESFDFTDAESGFVNIDARGFFNALAATNFLFSVPTPILVLQTLYGGIGSDAPFEFDFGSGSALVPSGTGRGGVTVLNPYDYNDSDEFFAASGILLSQEKFLLLQSIYDQGGGDLYLLAPGDYALAGLLEAFGNDGEGYFGELELVFIPAPSAATVLLMVGAVGLRRRR